VQPVRAAVGSANVPGDDRLVTCAKDASRAEHFEILIVSRTGLRAARAISIAVAGGASSAAAVVRIAQRSMCSTPVT
jgi:glycerol-3-phosphate dehydrogenase